MPRSCFALALIVSAAAPGLVNAGLIVPAAGYGDVSDVGVNTGVQPGTSIAFAGTDIIGAFGSNWRSYWVFQIPGGSGPVVSASFELAPRSYFGSASSETFAFTAFILSPSILSPLYNANDPAGVSIYNAIGSGASYGQLVVTPADVLNNCQNPTCPSQPGNMLSFQLNAAGLAATNASLGGTLVIGASLSSNPGTLYNAEVGGVQFNEFALQPDISQLNLTAAPEPSTLSLAAIAAFAGLVRHRRLLRR